MRDKDLAEVLAAIYRLLNAIAADVPPEDVPRDDLRKIKQAVEGMGGNVE